MCTVDYTITCWEPKGRAGGVKNFMKIAEINMLHFGSTGKIMFGIAESIREHGHDAATFSPRYYHYGVKAELPAIKEHRYFGNRTENMLHLRLSQLTGFHGCFSFFGILDLLRMLDEFEPDVVHLHNLHNWTINLPLLFRYIKRRNLPVVWTLHDCWSFTGQCPHFVVAKCDKWRTGCYHCPQIGEYPKSFVDNTRLMYRLKKKWFTGIEKMTLVTPSEWLAGLVRESFLKDYEARIIHNGLDLSVFKPMESDFRQKYHIEDKKIVLGVAFGWGVRKGLDVFCRLAETLGDQYQIVLVGTNEMVDKKLPANIISIHRTNNQQELALIYSAADVFANPTREEMFGMVNIEALACGTPVITFETGGSPESIDETCGSVVPCDDVEAMGREIRRVCEEKPFTREACIRRAAEFDMRKKFGEYVELYREFDWDNKDLKAKME